MTPESSFSWDTSIKLQSEFAERKCASWMPQVISLLWKASDKNHLEALVTVRQREGFEATRIETKSQEWRLQLSWTARSNCLIDCSCQTEARSEWSALEIVSIIVPMYCAKLHTAANEKPRVFATLIQQAPTAATVSLPIYVPGIAGQAIPRQATQRPEGALKSWFVCADRARPQADRNASSAITAITCFQTDIAFRILKAQTDCRQQAEVCLARRIHG